MGSDLPLLQPRRIDPPMAHTTSDVTVPSASAICFLSKIMFLFRTVNVFFGNISEMVLLAESHLSGSTLA